MRWSYINKTNLVSMQCTNPYKGIYLLALTPHAYTNKQDETENSDTRYVSIRVEHRPTLQEIKQFLLDIQTEYDSMNEVNGFKLRERTVWFDKATRVGLVNSIAVKKRKEFESIELWFGKDSIYVDIDYAEEFLDNLELYAMTCYNITEKHKAEINNLETIEDALEYDITKDYPPQIKFDITKIVK